MTGFQFSTSSSNRQSNDSDTGTIIGASVGSLVGLAALATAAGFLYRWLQRKNQIDDDGSSTNDVTPIMPPGGMYIPEAPNSVAPAGTA